MISFPYNPVPNESSEVTFENKLDLRSTFSNGEKNGDSRPDDRGFIGCFVCARLGL